MFPGGLMYWVPHTCPAVALFTGPLITDNTTYRTPTPQDIRDFAAKCIRQKQCQIPTSSCNHKCQVLQKYNTLALNQVECELACLGKQKGALLQWRSEAVALLRMGPPKRIPGCNISAFPTNMPHLFITTSQDLKVSQNPAYKAALEIHSIHRAAAQTNTAFKKLS